MDYKQFEKLVLVIGGAVVLASLGTAMAAGSPDIVEIAAQFMLFGVLAAAVKYGRKGGLIAAVIASTVYIALRVDLLASGQITPTALMLILSRVLAYGLVGILGGEACGRMKYTLTKMEGGSALDEWSRVYNQRWAYKTLTQALGRFRRYGEPFSVATISISSSVTANLSASKQRALARGVADHLRADIRMVDEVARLDDGRFLVILPHTPAAGAVVVTDRVAQDVRKVLGVRAEAVECEPLSVPEHEGGVEALIAAIAPPEPVFQASATAGAPSGA